MKKIGLIVLFVFLKISSICQAQLDPVALQCLNIQTNGDVEISWTAPIDPGSLFDAYQIYYSTGYSGPYALVGQVNNYFTTTYIHVGANGQTSSGYYYVVVRSNAPVYNYSMPSDTLNTLRLNLTNPLNGTAILNWNQLHNPLPAGSGLYQLLAEFPAGNWTLQKQYSVNHAIDTIFECNAAINYKVVLINASGCQSVSSIKGDVFQNLIPPEMPILDSVSVSKNTGNAILGWQSSSSEDTHGYIIYLFQNEIWTPIDTVFGINNTFYENLNSEADIQSESYCIATLDSCGLTSPLTPGQSTIHLQASAELCQNRFVLQWTIPEGFSTYTGQYIILRSINNSEWETIGNVNNALTYLSNEIPDEGQYCFIIQCLSDHSVSSNKQCLNINKPDLPQYVYIRKASVTLTLTDSISFSVDPTVEVPGYHLYRAASSGIFQFIQFFPYSTNGNYTFIDASAPQMQNRYYIGVEDSCNNIAMVSDTIHSIWLSGQAQSDLKNTISWIGLAKWPQGIQKTEIFRAVDGTWETDPIAVFSSEVFEYDDDVSNKTDGKGFFKYRIRWIENQGNPLGFQDTMYSNVIELVQSPRIYVPNAFTPNNDGLNDVFIPRGIFVDPDSYELYIFDREDRIVFFTKDFLQGWDGLSDKGNEEKLDTYVYLIRLLLSNGVLFEKRGIVTKVK